MPPQPYARELICFASAAVAPMRVVIAAVGRLKQGPERELAASYRKRAEATGRALGLREIEVIEIRESRAQDEERRRVEESIAIANIIPEGAVVIVLDGRGENLDSAALAELCASGGRRTVPLYISLSAAPTGLLQA